MSCLIDLYNNPAPKDTCNTKKFLRDTSTEFLATTVFVYAGTLSAASTGAAQMVGAGVATDVARILPIAFSFGVSIMALVHSIGHISGGHMNPGVTCLMFLRRQISAKKTLAYMAAQMSGALVGASLLWGSTSELAGVESLGGSAELGRPPFALGSTTLSPDISTGNGFLLEFMGSFLFFFVIAQTALDKRGIAETAIPAIPIGLILVVVNVCLIPFTGCGVNPARTFGPSIVTCMASSDLCKDVAGDWYWIYYVGPLLAAFAVAEVTNLLQMDVECQEAEETIVVNKEEHNEVIKDEEEPAPEQPVPLE